jgi:hypothetical protein
VLVLVGVLGAFGGEAAVRGQLPGGHRSAASASRVASFGAMVRRPVAMQSGQP